MTGRPYRQRVTLQDDTGEALKKLTSRFMRSATSINQSLELVGKAWGLLEAGLSALVGGIQTVTAAASEQEKVDRRLIAALAQKTDRVDEAFAATQRFNSEIQQSLGIGDEQLEQLQGTLLAMGIMPDKLQAATKATIGFADATGGKLAESSRTVARALTGQVSALTRYGIVAKNAEDATQKLVAQFDIVQAQSGTYAQRMSTLNANWGDFLETLGFAVTQSGALQVGVSALSDGVLSLIGIFESSDGRKIVNDFFQTIAKGTADAANALLGFLKLRRDLRKEIGVDKSQKTEAIDIATGLTEAEFKRRIKAFEGQLAIGDPGEGVPFALGELRQQYKEFLANRLGATIDNEIKTAQDATIDALETLANKLTLAATAPIMPAAGRRGVIGVKPPPTGKARGLTGGELFGPHRAMFEAQLAADEERSKARRLAFETEQREFIAQQVRISEIVSTGYGALAEVAGVGFGAIAQAITAGIQGGNIGEVFSKVIGQALVGWGTMLIQAGIVGSILGAISTIAPGVGGFLGVPPGAGPVLVGLSIAAGAAGLGLVALGGSMGGSGAKGSGARSGGRAGAGGGGGGSSSRAPSGFDSRAPSGGGKLEPTMTTINISFGRGFITGSPRRIARDMLDTLREAGVDLAAGAGR